MQGNIMQNIFEQTMKNNKEFYNKMQFHANTNNPYLNNFQQTWNNFQPNAIINNTNMNNMKNLLSLINFPILVPYHVQHPLINCKIMDRIEQNEGWVCNVCKNSYTCHIPSFYCTACEFDLCQKCLLSLPAYQIVMHYYQNKTYINLNELFKNSKYINSNIHPHPILKIQKDNSYFTQNLKCNNCQKTFQGNEQFYFCSLCNFRICINCHNAKKNNNIIINSEYLDGNF